MLREKKKSPKGNKGASCSDGDIPCCDTILQFCKMIPSGKTRKMAIGDFSVLVLKSVCDNSILKRVIKILKVKGREAKISGFI